MKTLNVGDTAPIFSLQDQNNQTVSLNDFIGQRILIYFYPKAMTPGCTVQACGLRDSSAELNALNVKVFGISTDAPEKLAKFAARDELNFTLLSDLDHTVADQYGVWGEKKFMGKIYDGIHRISFLIGTDGKIEHRFDTFKTSNHHQVVLDYLKNNQ